MTNGMEPSWLAGGGADTADEGEPGRPGPLLEADRLSMHFRVGRPLARKVLRAVDDVSFSIGRAEIVALVGESGSGKSTIARMLAGTYRPTSGTISFEGRPVGPAQRSRSGRLEYRGDVPMVLQDPFSSLNPAYPAEHGLLRSLKLHRPELDARARSAEALRLAEAAGLAPAERILKSYPHELSGGQRQRIGFAQALSCRPKLIIADEPVSMLDVSVRIGLLNLMTDLRDRDGVSLLYITHDIASARYVADRVLVMYGGHIVEAGPAESVLREPQHPYSRLLVSTVIDPGGPDIPDLATGVVEPPNVIGSGAGCRYEPRCPLAVGECATLTPALTLTRTGPAVACHVVAPTADGAGRQGASDA